MRYLAKLSFIISLLLGLVVDFAHADDVAVWRYAFRPGDNLIHFSKKHLINPEDWPLIQAHNHIKNPHYIPIGTVIEVPLRLVKFKPTEASVVSVSGKCHQQQGKDKQALKVGERLPQGTLITTGQNSQVVIQFADGSTSQLNADAQLLLDNLSLYSGGVMVDTKVSLQQGQLETHANPGHQHQTNMQVQTPSAIAAVRGTKFRVRASDDATVQETLEGGVDLSASQQVIQVAAGYGSKAQKGQPPQPPVQLLPAIKTNGLKTKFYTLPISFDLPQLAGAKRWVTQVAKNKTFNQVVDESTSDTQTVTYQDLPDGEYYLKVRGQDAAGIAGYDATHAFLVDARPFAPVLPKAAVTYKQPQPELSWPAVDGAIGYVVQIAKQGDSNQQKMMEKTTSASFKPTQPLAEGQYSWRVATIARLADGSAKKGRFSKLAHFAYIAPPPKPDISQLDVKVVNNRVYVNTSPAIDDYQYYAVLHNPRNHQEKVWVGSHLSEQFNFLLKEYGKQTLEISYIRADGEIGPAAIYEFDASSVW